MYLGLESIYQEKIKNKQLFAGFLIAFGLFIKLYTIVLIPYFLYRGKFKPVIYSGAFAFLSISATYLIFDIEYVNQLWKGWISQISKNEWDYLLEIEMENNHGIGTLISSLFIVDLPKEAVPVRNHIIELSKENVYIIICTAKVVLISFTLYFIRTLPFKQAKDKRYFAWEISYLFLVIPLIFPQQRPYNFVLLLPAIYYILTYVNLHQKKYVVALLIVSVVLINLELWLGEFREYYTHFKTLTYGSLGLLITLSLSKPAKSSKELTLNE